MTAQQNLQQLAERKVTTTVAFQQGMDQLVALASAMKKAEYDWAAELMTRAGHGVKEGSISRTPAKVRRSA